MDVSRWILRRESGLFGKKTMILFYCLSARASKGYFEYNAKKVILHLRKSWQMTPWFEFGYARKVHFLGKR